MLTWIGMWKSSRVRKDRRCSISACVYRLDQLLTLPVAAAISQSIHIPIDKQILPKCVIRGRDFAYLILFD